MLLIRQIGQRSGRFLLFLCIALLLAQGLAGCGSASQAQAGAASAVSPGATTQATEPHSTQTAGAPVSGPTQQPGTSAAATPQATVSAPVLHGVTNFLLSTPFNFARVDGVTTDSNGNNVSLDSSAVKTQVMQELKHQLFVVDESDHVKVYDQGTAPTTAQVLFNPDGSATINYTQTADSEAGSISILFSGRLSSKTMEVSYDQQYTPSIMINAQASEIAVDFTAPVQWVTPHEIPAAPSNGATQMTGQGGVALSWSAGQNAVSYDIYRLISNQSQQFTLLATVKGTSYTDNSSDTIKNVHSQKGITYAIFSVGSTGVENPGGIILSV